MLAQNFLTATALQITEEERTALTQVLGMLERGELKHDTTRAPNYQYMPASPTGFNMNCSGRQTACGTVACIGGWVALLMGKLDPVDYVPTALNKDNSLRTLYYPHTDPAVNLGSTNDDYDMEEITVEQAASATRNFLTCGEARWAEVLNG